ncbi:hypothetical protein JW899_00505 [Candidatus Uhrbacteria bacterium]|nr:hypothetical protein [Candidatus Uhrbacteria bacterium]
MNSERPLPRPEEDFVPASENGEQISDRLRDLDKREGKFMSRGVFFDVYEIELPDESGNGEPYVFKDFRSGDVIMDEREQLSLFQHQYYEWNYLKGKLGDRFFPESFWVRSSKYSADEAHGFYEKPGKTANTMTEFMAVQLDRQLADRYNADDRKRTVIKRTLKVVGQAVGADRKDRPFIGAVIQRKVRGVPLSEALDLLELSEGNEGLRQVFRKEVADLLSGLREYHGESDHSAFTWHGLDSENVLAEKDDSGQLTGRLYVVDANFIERPNRTFKDAVVRRLEENVLKKLETALGLQ